MTFTGFGAAIDEVQIISAVPESSTALLLSGGLIALTLMRRRR